MSCYLHAENNQNVGSIYVRENGQLYRVNQTSSGVNSTVPESKPSRLFSKGFSVQLCVNKENDNGRADHFIFTYTKKGNLRYTAKSLFSLVLSYIANNIHHVDSLIGFPEQIAEKLFYAADARQRFSEPSTGLRALQKFTESYGSLVLRTLCLRNRYFLIPKKLEEIKSFQGLICLDLSFCELGDEHELLAHLASKALSSLTQLLLKDNCLSDVGLRKMTAPVRVMKRGLENLSILDLSCNPRITNVGVGYLLCFKKLNYLDLSGTGLKDTKTSVHWIQTQIGLVHSEVPLKEFDHSSCKTEGWAEHTVLQWGFNLLEAIAPEEFTPEELKSRAAAQRFYGKRDRKKETGVLVSPQREKNRGNLQFYRREAELSHFHLRKTEMSEEQQDEKISPELKEQNLKSKQLNISVEDWDLLNSYYSNG